MTQPTAEQIEVTQADRDAATKKWEEAARHNYEAGNALFRDLRAFLDTASLDPSRAKLIIQLPTESERATLVKALQFSSPPISEFSRLSSAQAGNYGGKWQGVEYEFSVPSIDAIQSTEARCAEMLENKAQAMLNIDPDGAQEVAEALIMAARSIRSQSNG